MPKTVLITGCSAGGIGSALALSLAQRGHHIFVTLRNTAKVDPTLSALSNVTVLQLDVTSSGSISVAAEAVSKETQKQGHKGLDVLINNAGAGYTIPILDADISQAKRLFDTNLWGYLACIQGFADLLIQSRGKVINVSSVAAELNTPWMGIYTASKSAVSALSETLRLELEPFGVTVQTILVGRIATSFEANQAEVVLPPSSRYAVIRDIISAWATGHAGPTPMPLRKFAESLVKDVESRHGGVIWRGYLSTAVWASTRFLPSWVVDMMIGHDQGLDVLRRGLKAGGGK